MTGVVFIFVREDASEAETLAEAFDEAGFSITGNSVDHEALSVVIWSRAALRCEAFRDAAERALNFGRAVVASLDSPPLRAVVGDTPVVDLADWDGEDGPALDALFETVDRLARSVAPDLIALPAWPIYEDAEFVEVASPREGARIERARHSWEAPIPTDMLRPMRTDTLRPVRSVRVEPTPPKAEPLRPHVARAPRAEPAAPKDDLSPAKQGAPSPRLNFRRLRPRGERHVHRNIFAALALAVFVLMGGGLITSSVRFAPPPEASKVQVRNEPIGVTLTAASAEAVGLEDIAPVESSPVLELAPQVERVSAELPTVQRPARHAARASAPRRAPRPDMAAYRPPAMIPASILPDVEPASQPMLVAEQPAPRRRRARS